MIWLWVNTAFAYNITMCVDVNVDYPLSSAGGDNWTDNAVHKAARGFHYIVYKPYPTIYTTGNLSEADGDAGCTTVVGPGATYELKIQPSAEIGGNTLIHDDAGEVRFTPFVVSGDTTKNYTISYGDETYQQLVAAAYAVHNHDLGTAATITLHACSGLCSFTYGGGDDVDLSYDADKYLISHEIGHALMFQQTDIDDAVCACSSGCNGGDNLNRKWWAQGFKEGIAWWYAMITWNARSGGSGGDCDWLNNQLLDVDLNGTTDYAFDVSLPCWGDLDTTAPDYTDGEDWLDDLYTNNPTVCTGSPVNHTTEYDIVHYAWGLYAYGDDSTNGDADDLTANEIMTLILAASPSTWDPDEGVAGSANDPWPKWDAAAAGIGGRTDAAHDHQKGAVDH